jgi:release factor glutamine methyltransferase
MMIKSALEYGKSLLKSMPECALDVELLLACALKVSRVYLHTHPEEIVAEDAWNQYQLLCQRRLKGEPVAYLLGVKEFWSMTLKVNRHTLVPRPETETLVQLTLDQLPSQANLTIADLGCGSGAVALAIATERPHWQIYATDLSKEALKIAKYNMSTYGLKNIILLQSNWCKNLPQEKFDGIVGNPPYISRNDPHLKELIFEPQEALVAGEDGLQAILIISREAGHYLKEGGLLLLEHGSDQALEVRNLLQAAGFTAVKSYPDLNGILRVTAGSWQENH